MAREKALQTHQMREQWCSWQVFCFWHCPGHPQNDAMSLCTSSHLPLSVWSRAHQSLNATLPAYQAGLGFLCESLCLKPWPMQLPRASRCNSSLLASVLIQQFQEETARYCSLPNQKLFCQTTGQWRWELLSNLKGKANKYKTKFCWSSWMLWYQPVRDGSGAFLDSLWPGLIFSWCAG